MAATSLWKTVVCASPDGHFLVPGARASGADGRSPALPFPSPLPLPSTVCTTGRDCHATLLCVCSLPLGHLVRVLVHGLPPHLHVQHLLLQLARRGVLAPPSPATTATATAITTAITTAISTAGV
jgi:hypothetical protein